MAAAETAPPTVSQTDLPLVKAAIIYNICKFVEWPSGANGNADFVIGSVADEADGPDLASLAGKKIHNRNIRVIKITNAVALPTCQALYLGRARLDAAMAAAIAGAPVLTFSESSRDESGDGIIELVPDETRIRFNIRRGAADRAGLKLSSQLLKLALAVVAG
jgi:hypothetical protein